MAYGRGVRVAKCPIGQEYCYSFCYFRKDDRCCFRSKRGRQIPELKKKGGNHMAYGKGVRVAKCPIGEEYCYPSCYFRKGNRCCFRSKRGRQIPELKKERR